MGAATRIYWTFKVLGHDKMSILDGGWLGWAKPDAKTKKPVNPIVAGGVSVRPQVFKAQCAQGHAGIGRRREESHGKQVHACR